MADKASISDLKRKFGIIASKNKDYYIADPRNIERHKHDRGFSVSLAKDYAQSTSDGHLHWKGHLLLERNLERAGQETHERDEKARDQQSRSRDGLGSEVESLSSKHGQNLHKYVKKESFGD